MVHLTIKFIKHQIFYDFLPIYPDNLMKIKQSWPQPQPQEQKEVIFKIYTTLPFSHTGQQHWERQCFSFIDSTQIIFLDFTICMYQFIKICFWQKNPYNKKLSSKTNEIELSESIKDWCVNFKLGLELLLRL